MVTDQIVGLALIVAGIMDGIVGFVLCRRFESQGRSRILRIAFTLSTAIMVALGTTLLLAGGKPR